MRFGRLTVTSFAFSKNHAYWNCICDCGEKRIVAASNLKHRTRSCGCLWREAHTIHGKHKSPEFYVWASMIERCNNPKNKNYNSYGGRGISICDRWNKSFEKFFEDMGERPTEKHSLDRIDNNKGYSKQNCRWATQRQQSLNRRTTVMIEINSKKIPLAEAAEIYGIKYKTLAARYRSGWRGEKLFSTPK